MITVFASYRNSDTTEGRGPMVVDKVFTKETDAYAYINGQTGVMGRSPSQFGQNGWAQMGDWTVKSIDVYESLDEASTAHTEALKAKALAKLTPAERRALGL